MLIAPELAEISAGLNVILHGKTCLNADVTFQVEDTGCLHATSLR